MSFNQMSISHMFQLIICRSKVWWSDVCWTNASIQMYICPMSISQISFCQMHMSKYLSAECLLTKCVLAKCPLTKCLSIKWFSIKRKGPILKGIKIKMECRFMSNQLREETKLEPTRVYRRCYRHSF
jgi:hypothetical protein